MAQVGRSNVQKVGIVIVAFLILVLVIPPFYWTITASLKTEGEIADGTFGLAHPTLENYVGILTGSTWYGGYTTKSILNPLKNSLIVSLIATGVSLLIGSLAAYGLVFARLRARNAVSTYVLIAYIFPAFVLIVPFSMILASFRLINTLFGLTIAECVLTVPFVTWMLTGYFKTVPEEINSAAFVDGCSMPRCLISVILPMCLPGLVTAAIFSFCRAWGDILFPLIIINSERLFVLPLAVSMYAFEDIFIWGPLMASALVSALPPLILYMFVQKYVVKGLMSGAIK